MSQQARLLAAAVYFVGLLFLAKYLNGSFWPPFGLEGLWFYSAAAALLLGEFVLEPFYTVPADAIANGVAVLVAVLTVSTQDAAVSDDAAQIGRIFFIVGTGVVIAIAAFAIVFKDSGGRLARWAANAKGLAGLLGSAWFLFSVLLLASGYAAFADSSEKVAVLYTAWFLVVTVAPVERVITALSRARRGRPLKEGTVEELIDPGMVMARLPSTQSASLGDRVLIGGDAAEGTVVAVTTLTDEPRIRVALDKEARLRVGDSVEVVGERDEVTVVGHVSEGSSIEDLVISTIAAADTAGMEEGRLLRVPIGEDDTLYQIVSAEIIGRSEHDYRQQLLRVRARKLGRWDVDTTRFEPIAWVPRPGASVRLILPASDRTFDDRFIGFVPGTAYGIAIDPHLAVTHNTAILGILGIGKTHLAWELMRRMLCAEIKVIALDITGRYSDHFADVCDRAAEDHFAGEIEYAIRVNRDNRAVRNDEAGNLHDFEAALSATLAAFVDGKERLLILNPNRFEVTRMEGKPFNNQANSMARLTMVEVTRIVAEHALALVQARERDSRDESAFLCLVLEEAHSLVPEWNSTANAAEQQATNGTVRALLQGRKYGLGCVVVTQRTANVTKSILNQCNTIFGMRVYDATGMGFLENYVGPTYSELLALLRDRQAIVFGRASSCNSPIIVDLNESEAFRDGFWTPHGGEVPVTTAPAVPDEDDIPF